MDGETLEAVLYELENIHKSLDEVKDRINEAALNMETEKKKLDVKEEIKETGPKL